MEPSMVRVGFEDMCPTLSNYVLNSNPSKCMVGGLWIFVPRSPTSRACLRLDSQDITSAHLWTTSITGISSLGSPLWLYITRLDTPLTENAWNKLVKLNLKPPNAIHDKLRKFAQSISSLPLGLHVFLIVTYECQKVKVNQHYAKDPSIKKR